LIRPGKFEFLPMLVRLESVCMTERAFDRVAGDLNDLDALSERLDFLAKMM
jgi:hypothetical protein